MIKEYLETPVTVTRRELKELRNDSRILAALYNAGVESWEWYDEALASLGEPDGE